MTRGATCFDNDEAAGVSGLEVAARQMQMERKGAGWVPVELRTEESHGLLVVVLVVDKTVALQAWFANGRIDSVMRATSHEP